jgi:hypothetical protein
VQQIIVTVDAPTGVRSDALALNATYPVGTTTIYLECNRYQWCAALPVAQTVVVTDNENPSITAAADVAVNNTVGACSAVVTLTAPTTGDKLRCS